MAEFEQSHEALRQLHETEMADLERMFLAHFSIAVPAALHCCEKRGISPPLWLVKAATKMCCDYVTGNAPKKRGGLTRAIARYRQDSIDYARWEIVEELVEKSAFLGKELKKLSEIKLSMHGRQVRDNVSKLRGTIGSNQLGVFAFVSEMLADTSLKGGPDTIKRSYRAVESTKYVWERGHCYYKLDPEFLKAIGAYVDVDVQVTKKHI